MVASGQDLPSDIWELKTQAMQSFPVAVEPQQVWLGLELIKGNEVGQVWRGHVLRSFGCKGFKPSSQCRSREQGEE